METLWGKYSYAIILIVLSLVIGLCMIVNLEDESSSYQQIVVLEGQSLWEIASLYADEHSLSTADFINWVQDKNELTTTMIKPGEKILIPVKANHHIDNENQFAFDAE